MHGEICCVHAGYIILSPIHLLYILLHDMDRIVAWWWTVSFKNFHLLEVYMDIELLCVVVDPVSVCLLTLNFFVSL